MISAIAIPALVALVFKLGLFGYSIRLQATNFLARLVLALLFAFAAHNFAEFMMLNYFEGEVTPTIEFLGFAYMAFIIPAMALTLHISLRLSFDLPPGDKRVRLHWLLYIPAAVLLYLLLATDQLVAGFQMFRNTLLRISGPLYVLFEVYLPSYLLVALASLVYGSRGSRRSANRRNRNRLWLLVLLPIGLAIWYLIIANHYGLAKFTSTIYMPIPWTLFLLVAIYTTHHYRLFDIGFFIPGSKVRKRKTKLHRHIRALITEIADLRSVQKMLEHLADAFHCQVALIGGPRPLAASVAGQQSDSSAYTLLQFPREALQKIDNMIVADEIADSGQELYALMSRHHVGAIVPINFHNEWSAYWILLGEGFSEQVYTPLDFKIVGSLFDRIAECFLDDSLPLRSQLVGANDDLREFKRRLALAWDELDNLRKKAASAEAQNLKLSDEEETLLRQRLTGIGDRLPESIVSGEKTLERYLADTEAEIAAAALKCCAGNKAKAARLLGMSLETFHSIMER